MATKLFVGNLPFNTTQEALAAHFAAVGAVKTVELGSRRFPNRPITFGFVEMETPELAAKAIQDLNGQKLQDRDLKVELARPATERPPRAPRSNFGGPRVGGFRGGFRGGRGFRGGFRGPRGAPRSGPRPQGPPAQPSPTRVYVNNIPWSTDDNALLAHFQQFTPKSAHVIHLPNGMSRGYGFVEFETTEQQQAAINALNNSMIGERPIACRAANIQVPRPAPVPGQPAPAPLPRTSGPRRGGFGPRRFGGPRRQQGPPQPDSATRIFVANLPFSVDDQELARMFSRFPVKEAHVATWPSGVSRGFGFVEFNDHDSQQQAIATFNQQNYADRVVTVRVAREPRAPVTPAPTNPTAPQAPTTQLPPQ